jgi:signal transduction histidine kinase
MEIAWVQSHEVRGPLARIMGLIQLIQHDRHDTTDVRDTLRHILENAKELDEIIRKIVRKTEEIV